ncbi:MAG: MFS transporter [Chloroflexota bacterium]
MKTSNLRWKPPTQIFYGWWLVGISLFTLTAIITPINQGLGFFFVALERQFGWSRAVLSIPFSLSRVEGALLGPLEGYLTDRLGSRRMILIGFAILGAGFVAFSLIQGVIGYYLTFLLIFAGAGLGGFIPLMAAINHWFRRHRTKAMAIGMIGINLGALLAPFVGRSMDAYGWRPIALWLGIGVWVLTVPIALLVRNRPEEYGQRPDGDSSSDTEASAQEAALEDEGNFTVGEALRTTAFWAIAAAHGFSAVAAVTIAVHIIPAMTDIGMSMAGAGTVVLTYGVAGSISQVAGGFLGDRLPKQPLIAVFVVIQGMGVLVAATIQTVPGAYLFAVLYGTGLGPRIPLLTAIRGDYFGRKKFATILGVSQLPMNIAMVGAPIAAGYFFDTLGSYMVPFLGLAILNFLGAALILIARKPALPERHQEKLSTQARGATR